MVALYLSPIYIIVSIYLLRWLLKWLGACHFKCKSNWIRAAVVAVYTFLASSMLTGFVLPRSHIQRFFKMLGNYWLGVLLYVVMTVAVADAIRLALKHNKHIDQEKLASRRVFVISGGFCIALITTVCTLGAINARIIHTTKYSVNIEKTVQGMDSLNVVLVADLHLGYNIGCEQISQMVAKINAQNPDIVVIAGDIFDNEYEALDDPDRLVTIFKCIESKYGVYAVYGNHDIEEKILAGFTFGSKEEKKMSDPQMDELLEKANITLLRDEAVLIQDSFYLYGRPDYQRLGRGIEKRKTPQEITAEMDLTKPVIVIDHQPRELDELSEAGVDLDLCGHTHDGQLFPLNLTGKLIWENSCGSLKKGNMTNIVTSGVGLYGPNMRVATKAEICQITINFQ